MTHPNLHKKIESIRQSIQLLSQSAYPLGKRVDYIQEDLDSMDKELEHWTKLGLQYQKQFEKEKTRREKEKGGMEWKILEKELEKVEEAMPPEFWEWLSTGKRTPNQHNRHLCDG